jgi:hypothetical protein
VLHRFLHSAFLKNGFFKQSIHDSSKTKSRRAFPDLNPEKALKTFKKDIRVRLCTPDLPAFAERRNSHPFGRY